MNHIVTSDPDHALQHHFSDGDKAQTSTFWIPDLDAVAAAPITLVSYGLAAHSRQTSNLKCPAFGVLCWQLRLDETRTLNVEILLS